MIRYIFFDDEQSSTAYSEYLNRLSTDLVVETHLPADVSDVIARLQSGNYQGALLDIAFDHAEHGGKPLQIDGLSLAQHIRSLQKRGEISEMPLVRLSQPSKESLYVGGDTTSNDLFDERISKDSIREDSPDYVKLLAALAEDYPRLARFARSEKTDGDIADLLSVEVEFLDGMDSRFLLGFVQEDAPAHTISRFLTEKVLRRPGPLVDERLLAIRLGVDRSRSGGAWSKLLEVFASARYGGCFSDGFARWWWYLIVAKWTELSPDAPPLARLTAEARVAHLTRTFPFAGVAPIGEDKRSPGDKFWNLCASTRLPVDPTFGFVLQSLPGHEPWQDVEHLCLEAALRQAGNRRLSSVDRAKLVRLRKSQVQGGQTLDIP